MSNLVDIRKTIETIVYVSTRVTDLFHLLKVMYFADKRHLAEYGRLITGDRYIAMKDGPVPSAAYDIIKHVRGDGIFRIDYNPNQAFRVEDHTCIYPMRVPDLEFLSESDIEALDEAIETYGAMPFRKLWRIAHQEDPYEHASRNSDISLESIAMNVDESGELLEYLNS